MAISIRTVRAACVTTNGTQDFTVSGFGTPAAAIFVLGTGVTDGTAAVHVNCSIGFTDGTNQGCIHFNDEDGQTTTDLSYGTRSDSVIYQMQPGSGASTHAVAGFDSWITDGVRVNFSNAPPDARLLTVVLINGSDVSAYVGNTDLADTVDTATDITAPGFEPDIVFAACSDAQNVNATQGTNIRPSFGVIHNDGAGGITQRSLGLFWDEGVGTTICTAMLRTDGGVFVKFTSSLDWYGEFGTFDSSGFTVTTRNDGGNGTDLVYLALKFANHSSYVGTYSTPTSTGSHSNSSVGFTPQFIMHGMNFCEAAATNYDDNRGGVIGISVADSTNQYSTSFSSEDGVTTTNTQSIADDTIFECPDDDGTAGITASFTSFDANGYTVNYSAVEASAKLFWVLAVEETAVGGRTTKNTDIRPLGLRAGMSRMITRPVT